VKTVAIVLEWENVLLAGMDRSRRMLTQLNAQVPAFAAARGVSFELLVIFNPEDVDPAIPQAVVPEQIDVARWPGRIAYLQAPGVHYFEQKNFGAERAASDIVLFLDSDVIPEDGWLERILSQFDDPKNEVIAGCTYLDNRTVIERCFALFWFFPPKLPRPGLYDSPSFYANNVAFRRPVFLANPFPVAESYRGQGAEMARGLLRKGHRIRRHGEAWVNHPSPNGLRHVLVRAVATGYDIVYWNRRRKRGWLTTSPLGALGRFARTSGGVAKRVFRRRRALQAGLPLAFLAVMVGLSFRFVVLLSECVAFVSPGLIRRNFSI
jgi:hypothetical protein